MALGRFVLALSALDAGSAFGGMGSSREVAISALAEPALLLALAGAALAAGSTDLGIIAQVGSAAGRTWFTPALLLGAGALPSSRSPRRGTSPSTTHTHLELTMIHEGMLLEASGPQLAILMYAAELKLVLVAGLFAAAFLPIGMAPTSRRCRSSWRSSPPLVKLVAAAVALALLDASLAKIRILALPGLLATASILALIGLATRLWLPA